jgi:hypothetical protein
VLPSRQADPYIIDKQQVGQGGTQQGWGASRKEGAFGGVVLDNTRRGKRKCFPSALQGGVEFEVPGEVEHCGDGPDGNYGSPACFEPL